MNHDEPLVIINRRNQNGFTVSNAVNQRDYHVAFENMPLPSSVSNEAYKNSGRILQKADGQNKEYLVAIDARTGSLVADNLKRGGTEGRTTFVGDELDLVEAHEGEVIVIHNHPHSLAPSYRDVITASRNEAIAGAIVVGHDGSVWYYSAPSTRIAEELESAYNVLKDELGDTAEAIALNNLIKKSRKVGFVWQKLR